MSTASSNDRLFFDLPKYVTSLLLYENGNFWYTIECCTNPNHTGLLVSNTNQAVGTCAPEKRQEVTDITISLPTPIEESPPPLPDANTALTLPENIKFFSKKIGVQSAEPNHQTSNLVLAYVRLDSITFKDGDYPEFAAKLRGKYCKIYRPRKYKDLRFGCISSLTNNEFEIGTGRVMAFYDNDHHPILELEVSYKKNGNRITHLRVFCIVTQ